MWGSGETRGILDEILPYCRQECQEMPLMVVPAVRNQILAAADCLAPLVQYCSRNNLFPNLGFCQQTTKTWTFRIYNLIEPNNILIWNLYMQSKECKN